MDLFNKAKEAMSGGDSSDKKKDSSIFSKAMEAAEKYHAKEKVAEFAQKQVAKREEEKRQPGYTEKKDKSVIDKAVQAAEDFLAKQGEKCKDNKADNPKENVESVRRSSSCSSSSSSSPHSEPEKRPQPARNLEPPHAGVSHPSYPPNGEADVTRSLGRMNLGSDAASPVYNPPSQAAESYPSYGGSSYPSGSSSGRNEIYQEYWDRQDNNPNQRNPSYPNGAPAGSYEGSSTNGYPYQGNASTSYGYPSNDHV